ncbi:hypothetical protein FHX42_003088 [Saccharopolyspora lacisalsi]|uniref:J domain-containing protein n=1 Tax=Halosaccharopolyspora lacisalsi TaxID=1000566 RepID=A0A839DUQ9_9PSEU|nr:hypothetical protein [Halosaccharopolyspora lacisalsi]
MTDEDRTAGRAATPSAAVRAFARAHHPDTGGDPEVFATGMAELQRARERARRGREPAKRHDRFDAPIVVVTRSRGPFGLAQRLRAWYLRHRRAPRVS